MRQREKKKKKKGDGQLRWGGRGSDQSEAISSLRSLAPPYR